MHMFRRSERKSAAAYKQPAPTPFEVLITERGDCTIAGMPLALTGDEALHEAVLDYLHRLAQATGHPVLATVHDRRGGYTIPIVVKLDGSSEAAGQPEYALLPLFDQDEPAPAPDPSAAHPEPRHIPSGTPEPMAPSRPAAPESPAPAEVRDYPEPDVRPDEPSQPQEAAPQRLSSDRTRSMMRDHTRPAPSVPNPREELPQHLAVAVTRINEAINNGHLEFAAATVHTTIESVCNEFGHHHDYTTQLRELHAHISYLAGDAARSMSISLSVCRGRIRRRDPYAYASLLRAAAVWPAIQDPQQGLKQGEVLIGLWSQFLSPEGSDPTEVAKLAAARERMTRLAARAARATTQH